MHAMQTPITGGASDRVLPKPSRSKLRARHHTVLPSRKLRDVHAALVALGDFLPHGWD
jgi:hypothetical protein